MVGTIGRGAPGGLWEGMQKAQQQPRVVANPLAGVVGILMAVRLGPRQSGG